MTLMRCPVCKRPKNHQAGDSWRCEDCQSLGSARRDEPMIQEYREKIRVCEWYDCGIDLGRGGIIDHIVPLIEGGITEWRNLRKLCERHNLMTQGDERKDNRTALARYDRKQKIKGMQDILDSHDRGNSNGH